MSLEQLHRYLQEYYGIPIVLRRQGDTVIKCLYSGGMHEHAQPGHIVACDEQECGALGIIVVQRSFVPNWGYDIFE